MVNRVCESLPEDGVGVKGGGKVKVGVVAHTSHRFGQRNEIKLEADVYHVQEVTVVFLGRGEEELDVWWMRVW